MTAKDFTLIADILYYSKFNDPDSREILCDITAQFADALQVEFPRFNREKFFKRVLDERN